MRISKDLLIIKSLQVLSRGWFCDSTFLGRSAVVAFGVYPEEDTAKPTFLDEIDTDQPQRGKHYIQPKGYAFPPGTGTPGETCRTCEHRVVINTDSSTFSNFISGVNNMIEVNNMSKIAETMRLQSKIRQTCPSKKSSIQFRFGYAYHPNQSWYLVEGDHQVCIGVSIDEANRWLTTFVAAISGNQYPPLWFYPSFNSPTVEINVLSRLEQNGCLYIDLPKCVRDVYEGFLSHDLISIFQHYPGFIRYFASKSRIYAVTVDDIIFYNSFCSVERERSEKVAFSEPLISELVRDSADIRENVKKFFPDNKDEQLWGLSVELAILCKWQAAIFSAEGIDIKPSSAIIPESKYYELAMNLVDNLGIDKIGFAQQILSRIYQLLELRGVDRDQN